MHRIRIATVFFVTANLALLAACSGGLIPMPPRTEMTPSVRMVIDPYTEQATAIEAPAELGDVVGWRELTARTSVDVATKAFRNVATLPETTRRFESRYQAALAAGPTPGASNTLACYRLMLVPGWRYRSHPERGADLASIRDMASAMGFAAATIKTDEDDDVEDNARLIAAHIRGAGPGPIILFSVSKGSPEVALALDELLERGSDARAPLVAWINVNGLVGGTPLADLLERRPAQGVVRALARRDGTLEAIHSMTTATRRKLPHPPWRAAGMLVVNYLAAPLSREVSLAALPGFLTLSTWGPNDGIALLADTVIDHAITVTLPGTDHFLGLPDRDRRIGALLLATIAEVESQGGAKRFGCPRR